MTDLVDLHLHSLYSDGVLTPAELVREAAVLGLRAIAITDHDNVDGVDEGLHAGRQQGVEVLSGVELSVVWEDLSDLHLLGYGLEHHSPALATALREFRDFRAGRSRRILRNINRLLSDAGCSTLDAAAVEARVGGTPGRPHIARELVDKGLARDMEDAFVRFLVPCNEPKRLFPAAEAIAMIHAAGGCAVLAHPPLIRLSDSDLRTLVRQFMDLGLDGLEAYNTASDNQGIDMLLTLAHQMGLIVTGGSDFHQPRPGGVVMGSGRGHLKVPYRCVEDIRQRALRYC